MSTLEEKVVEFQEGHVDEDQQRKAENRLKVNNRKALYQTIQDGYIIASELMLPQNAAELARLLAKHGLQPARGNSNPWMPITNLLFGSWVRGKDTTRKTFRPDRSAKKYANSFRYFAESEWEATRIREILIDENGIENRIGKHFGKGLVGTERADIYQHRKEEQDERDKHRKAQVKRFWEGGLGFIPAGNASRELLATLPAQDWQFVALWGVKMGTDIMLYGPLPTPYWDSAASNGERAIIEAVDWLDKYKAATPADRASMPRPTLLPREVWKPAQDRVDAETAKQAEQAQLAKEAVRKGRRGIKTGGAVQKEVAHA